jgi:hypothetical protein
MNCTEFVELEDFDRAMYLASLIHVCQSDSALFKNGLDLIALGKRKGLLDKVEFFPDHLKEPPGELYRHPEPPINDIP